MTILKENTRKIKLITLFSSSIIEKQEQTRPKEQKKTNNKNLQ